MTDKQSTVIVSREQLEQFLGRMGSTEGRRQNRTELRALLEATPAQAVDVGEPVAWLCFDFEGGYEFTQDLELAEQWKKSLGEKYAECLTPLYRHAQPPAKSGPWEPLSGPGQIKPGDWLHFTVGGKFICTKAKEILEAGTHREEVVYNRSRNHYFITGMAVDGTSSHKGVMIAKR